MVDCRPSLGRQWNLTKVDWPASLRLYDEFGPLSLFRRAFRDENRRWPDASEIEEARGEQGLWAASFEEAMVLGADGEPFEWQSRTLAGRRRRFTVSMGGILRRVALATAGSPDPALRAILQRLGLPLLSGPALEKLLEDRLLRRSVVAGLLDEVGWEGSAALWRSALADGVRIMVNAHRNAPIQGGVADAMLAAYAELWQRLAPHNDLWPVLTVHDSIVVECPAERASEVAMMVEDAIVAGFGRFCTEVSVGVDIDVRPSLASPSKVG